MELGELVDHFRSVYLDDLSNQIEGQPDELFGQETIVRLFQKAQDEFAVKTWCIIDEESSICTIDLNNDTTQSPAANYTGLQLVPYSEKIVRVLRARFSDTDYPLHISGYGYAEPQSKSPYSGLEPFDVNVVSTIDSGRPYAVFFDASTSKMKFNCPLNSDTAALNLKMRVVRKAITPLSADDPAGEPEIPEDYHLDLCNYVAKELLKGPNLEADGRRLRAIYTTDWQASLTAARREIRRRITGPIGFKFGGWARK